MVDVSLFYSHFCSRKLVYNENYRGVGYAIDYFVDAVDRPFRCSPLLNRHYRSLFEVRSARGKVLSRKSMTLSLEDHSNLRNMHSRSFAGPRRERALAITPILTKRNALCPEQNPGYLERSAAQPVCQHTGNVSPCVARSSPQQRG
ncbi:hypothetical protein K432DRAFT_226131 [Lepidopterella palustris CBS 459.81]|uniref:Uncharacterized protein n=1 Tax=Lepidopterella palustris CBS 459.81 TaxID=1314670 RepID=A0A8E2JH52_9PEZI|nr:hypothetical protein K432DRAFT_226131 [Lepidopterella palustris CBS 459.81]